MGWTGDMQVFQKTAAYNMNIGAFTSRWLLALNDGQSKEGGYADFAPLHDLFGTAGWADAGIICPLTQYKMYGDKRILEKWYTNMARYIDYTVAQSSGFIRKPSCWPGDWLSVNAPMSESIITNMYFAYSANLMSEIAGVLDKEEDSLKYGTLFKNIKAAYIKKYINENNVIEGNTQTSYILSLAFDLVKQEDRAVSFQKLLERIQERDYHVSTGFLGVKHLFDVLTQFERSDVAYRLLKQDSYPGWLYNVSKGANTIWEAWDTWKPGVGWQDHSLNHFNFGAVGDWMYSGMGGIKPLEPGFRKILIEPQIDTAIKFVNATYNSIQGPIVSNWRIQKNIFSIQVEIPANTNANIILPVNPGMQYTITESGKEIFKNGALLSKTGDLYHALVIGNKVRFVVGSGRYHFNIAYAPK
jgi:alpha-L-rhamnosidase